MHKSAAQSHLLSSAVSVPAAIVVL